MACHRRDPEWERHRATPSPSLRAGRLSASTLLAFATLHARGVAARARTRGGRSPSRSPRRGGWGHQPPGPNAHVRERRLNLRPVDRDDHTRPPGTIPHERRAERGRDLLRGGCLAERLGPARPVSNPAGARPRSPCASGRSPTPMSPRTTRDSAAIDPSSSSRAVPGRREDRACAGGRSPASPSRAPASSRMQPHGRRLAVETSCVEAKKSRRRRPVEPVPANASFAGRAKFVRVHLLAGPVDHPRALRTRGWIECAHCSLERLLVSFETLPRPDAGNPAARITRRNGHDDHAQIPDARLQPFADVGPAGGDDGL